MIFLHKNKNPQLITHVEISHNVAVKILKILRIVYKLVSSLLIPLMHNSKVFQKATNQR